jgi:hypothetical protein
MVTCTAVHTKSPVKHAQCKVRFLIIVRGVCVRVLRMHVRAFARVYVRSQNVHAIGLRSLVRASLRCCTKQRH